ncbi:hypothetical protein C8R26_10611 [Nitrosomonas oligotropha]|uniref:Uncharacterized protein n=1 Tax=Nitrosomonas oligotropha TaxID=42354 RepID=A0A2T5I1F6_9PROT|nr:hypothetical protein [Nitrosomonas oligotropha]PTQ77667.1 hypothetical protein C8R26_10611 [Nitrosomonas oligotropha]
MNLSTVNPVGLIGPLFERAKAADEFEFCSTLLRLRGMEDAGWDPLHESLELSHQLMSLQNAPLDKGLKLRLALFLYCHLTEMSDVYNIPANMFQVISGHRYSMSPFSVGLQQGQNPPTSPSGKARRLKALADALNMQELGEVFEEMIVKEVRNAFYHSDYILTNESLNIRHGEGVVINRMRDNKVPYEWLLPRLQLGINTALAVLNLTEDSIRSYKQDKILQGRLGAGGELITIQLTTHPDFGLNGFKTPPDPAR